MKKPWTITLLTSAALALGFWAALLALTALGVGPLARFSPDAVNAESFEAIIGELGYQQKVIEGAVLAPALLFLSMLPLMALRIQPAIPRSIVVALPLAVLAGTSLPWGVALWALYSLFHYLLHLALTRAVRLLA